jgi:hypothetical protein
VTHPIDHPKLGLQLLNGPPPTPHPTLITGALGQCRSVELRLQPLTDPSSLMIQQRQEVLGLLDFSIPLGGKGDNLGLARHRHTIRPIHHSRPRKWNRCHTYNTPSTTNLALTSLRAAMPLVVDHAEVCTERLSTWHDRQLSLRITRRISNTQRRAARATGGGRASAGAGARSGREERGSVVTGESTINASVH